MVPAPLIGGVSGAHPPCARKFWSGVEVVSSPGGSLQPEVIERLRHGLQIMALHALGDREAAEEVAQESLVRALEALRDDRVRKPENLGAFVRGVARHVIADTCRGYRRSVPLDVVGSQPGTSADQDPLSVLVTKEELRRVHGALGQLSAPDRTLLRLCFFEGLAPTEIAERSGEPAPRIRKRKSRALKRLRETLRRGAGTVAESEERRGEHGRWESKREAEEPGRGLP